MANLIIPSRFTRQPQTPAGIASGWESHVTCAYVLTANLHQLNQANGKLEGTRVGTGGSFDHSGYISSGNKADYLNLPSGLTSASQWTILIGHTTGSGVVLWASMRAGWNGFYHDVGSGGFTVGNSDFSGRITPANGIGQHESVNYKAYAFYGLNDLRGASNGGLIATDTSVTVPTAIPTIIYIGAGGDDYAGAAKFTHLICLKRAVTDAELKSLSINPWQIFRKRPNILYFDVATGGATGTGALTTGVTTASGSGTLTHTGTGSLTTSDVTASGAGTLSHTGTGALTTISATLAGAGVITHTGTGSLTTGNVTLAGEGNVSQAGEVTGTGALTVSAITASGTGTITHTGTGSLQTSVVTLSGAGVLSHTGTGDLTTEVTTLAGEGYTLGTITGTGALTVGSVTVSGYDALPVAVKPTGGGGISTVSGRNVKRQKLIIVERVEDVEELLEQVEEIVQSEPKARKLKLSPKKPKQTVQNQPEAAFDWLSYYQAKLDTLRDQQRANALKRQLDKNAEIIRVILEKQEETARLALELQQEEEMMLLLMAA